MEIQFFWPRFFTAFRAAVEIFFSNRAVVRSLKILQKNDYFSTNSDCQHVRRRRKRLRLYGPSPRKNAAREKITKKAARRPRGAKRRACAARCDRGSSLHHTDERVRREGEETPPVDAGEATWAFETRSGERPPRSPRRRPRSRGRANRAAESEPEPPCWRCEAGASPRTESSRGRARTDRIPGRSPPPLTVSTPNVCADRLGDA